MTLRRLRPDDEAALAVLFEANDVPEVTRWFDPFPLDATTAGALVRMDGRDLYWGVWEGADLVGLAMVRGWDGGYPQPACGVLLDRRRRGRGLGTIVTGLVLDDLAARSVPEVRCRVHDDNAASLRMFVRNGFEEIERTPGRVVLRAVPGPRS